MEKYIYTILHDVLVTKSPIDGKIINQVTTDTNYIYYTTLKNAVKGLEEQLQKTKRWIKEENLEVEWIHHENVGSHSEFYFIKLKECVRPIGIYVTPLTLAE